MRYRTAYSNLSTFNGRYLTRWFLLAILCGAIASFSLVDYTIYRQDLASALSSSSSKLITSFTTPESAHRDEAPTSKPPLKIEYINETRTLPQTETSTSTTIAAEEKGFKLSFDVESNDICPFWTYNWTLFPNIENTVEYNRISPDIVMAQWNGKFTIPIYFPFGQTCVNGRALDESEKAQPVNYTAMLCGTITAAQDDKQYVTSSDRTTFIIRFGPEYSELNDILDDNTFAGLNIWHFHGQYIPVWLGLRLIEVTAYLMPTHLAGDYPDGVYPKTFKPIIDVVFIFPEGIWGRFTKPENKDPIVLEEYGKNIKELHENGGHETTLAGLQGIQDGFPRGSRVMVGTYSMTVEQIQSSLIKHGMNYRPAAYFPPQHRGTLLWRLASRPLKVSTPHCHASILQKYANDLLGSVETKYDPIAKHVCFLSRQIRAKPEYRNENSHVYSDNRNLLPATYIRFLTRLPSLLVLQFNLDLRPPSNANEMRNRSSITGQMRLVRNKCGVMFGVHGAGLSHIFAMRPGTHVIELQGYFKYDLFENSAALLPNVTHEIILINSTVTDKVTYREVNLTTTDDMVDSIVEKVKRKLSESIKRQTQLSQK